VDHLLRGKHAPGMAAHAVGDDGQRHAATARMRQDRHPVLLLATITLMLGHAGID
jgi:hypothetical protein